MGITIRKVPYWTMAFHSSEDIRILKLTITNCVMASVSKAISIGYMHSIVKNVTLPFPTV